MSLHWDIRLGPQLLKRAATVTYYLNYKIKDLY